MYTEGIVKGPERKLFRLSDGPYPTTFVLKTYNGPLDWMQILLYFNPLNTQINTI